MLSVLDTCVRDVYFVIIAPSNGGNGKLNEIRKIDWYLMSVALTDNINMINVILINIGEWIVLHFRPLM